MLYHKAGNMVKCKCRITTGPRDSEYDPYKFPGCTNGESTWGSVFHIFLVSTGPGLLTFPSTFMGLHNVTGSIVTFFVIWLYFYNVKGVLKSEYELCKLNRIPQFSNLDEVFDIFDSGPLTIRFLAGLGQLLYYVAFVAVWFGYNCYYYRLISRNAQLLYISYYGEYVSKNAMSSIFFLPLVLLCWIRRLKHMLPFSILGSICNCVSIAIAVYYVMSKPSSWQISKGVESVANIPILTGSVLLNVNGLGMVLLLKNDMKNPKKLNSNFGVLNLLFVPVSIITVVYLLSCNLKYDFFFTGKVFRTLPYGQTSLQIGTLIGILGLVFQYPLTMYVPFETIWNNFCSCKKNLRDSLVWEYALRTGLVFLSFAVCSLIPRVMIILSMFGTVGASVESLIIPALMEILVKWQLCKNTLTFRCIVLKNISIVIFAVWVIVSVANNFVFSIYDGVRN